MPLYGDQSQKPVVPTLTTGFPVNVFNHELITAGQQSQAVSIPGDDFDTRSYAVEFAFTDSNGNPANPGAFSLDILHATTDKATNYITAANVASGLNSNYVGRYEMTVAVTKFASLQLLSIANPGVYLTASFCK